MIDNMSTLDEALKDLKSVKNLAAVVNSESVKTCLKQLEISTARLRRTTALVSMSNLTNSYRPLVKIMCKLDLIKDWTIW